MLALLLALLLAFLPVAVLAQGGTSGTLQPSVLVTTEAPRQGSLPRTVTAYGTVQAPPGGSETLSVLRAGQVTQVMVTPGGAVRRGQALLAVSADPAALAAYKQAADARTLALGERARIAQMLGQRLATRDQLARADKAVSDAQANLDALNLGGGGSAEETLKAPFDGVVSSLPVVPGTRVAAGTPLLTITRSSQLVAFVGIEPAQRGLIAPGQPARIESLYGHGAEQGSVLSVGAMVDPTTRLVPLLVDPQSDLRTDPGRGDPKGDPQGSGQTEAGTGLLPGGAVRAVVQVGEMRGWLAPRNAVLTDAKGAYVFQVADSKAVRVDVRVVGTRGDTTVVAGPLDPSRPLVTSGNYQLHDGDTVREGQVSAGGEAAKP
ncbi:MAG TPA: HlyD family efflux transporter periplasmic adaptor subunit [Acetobacteraceae bacterium]|nr:HlyD family efflux transporter periplasmic adaptor subunit [Acetobacteraceae bacterium]